MTNAEKEAVRNIRIQAQRNGYCPLAIHNHQSLWVKNPVNRGKQPVGKNWQLGHDIVQLLDRITTWTSNTGLLGGDIGGGLVGFDLDITDGDVLTAVLRVAKATLPTWLCHRYRCNSRKILIPFRAAEWGWKKRATGTYLTQRDGVSFENKCEILPNGTQFVCAGRHTTGVELHWSGPQVWTVPIRELPEVTYSQIDMFLAAVAPLLGVSKTPARRTSAKRLNSELNPLSTDAPPHILNGSRLNLNEVILINQGFEKLGVVDKNRTVQECLRVLESLADTGRGTWLPLVIACWDAERLGATGARSMCLQWCRTSKRFVSEEEFNKDWASFKVRSDGATVATIIFHARVEGALLAALLQTVERVGP
jgi:hypothetical protein